MSLRKEFKKFLNSPWGLELWLACPPKPRGRRRGNKPIFRSKKSGVKGLLNFIKNCENVSRKDEKRSRSLVIFDKIIGRGAALLAIHLKAGEVYGALGSKLAAKVLKQHKVKFYFEKIVPNILNRDSTDLCPFEKLSLDKTPKEFYHCFRNEYINCK